MDTRPSRFSSEQSPRRFVAENTKGDPNCKLCRGMGTQGKANRMGLYKHCRCISKEAADAHKAETERYNSIMRTLHEARPQLPSGKGMGNK